MAILHVRNVPDKLYEALKRRAQESGRSLSAEVIFLLDSAARRSPRLQADILKSITRRRRFDPANVGAPSSTELIRQDRQRSTLETGRHP